MGKVHIIIILSKIMNRPVVIGGAILLVLSLIITVGGLWSSASEKPGDNIIHDVSIDGTTYTDTGDTLVIAVYAKGDFGCTQVEVSIIDITTGDEYFVSDCEKASLYSDGQFTFLGLAEIPFTATTVEIISPNNIVLVSHDDAGIGGLIMIGGCCCSFIGLIILIVGLVIGKNKNKQQGVMMVQQADGTVQPVGIMQQPNAASPMVGGAVHPAFATEQPASQPVQQQTTQQGQILPPIGGSQQPPNQGF